MKVGKLMLTTALGLGGLTLWLGIQTYILILILSSYQVGFLFVCFWLF